MRKILVGSLLLVCMLALLAPTARAGRSGPTGTLAMSSATRMAAGPVFGAAVAFDATYEGVKRQDPVMVQLICMQDGGVVYGDNVVLSSSPSTVGFVLGEPANGTSVWSGGAASCRSDLYAVGPANRVTFLASVAFEATA